MIRFTVHGRPQQRGSKTAVLIRGKTRASGGPMIAMKDSNARSGPWMDSVRGAAFDALPAGWTPYRCPLVLSAWFRFARPKSHYGKRGLLPSAPRHHASTPDLAKLVRAIEDAMTGIVYHDDRLICRYGIICRDWTEGIEGVDIEVGPIEEIQAVPCGSADRQSSLFQE